VSVRAPRLALDRAPYFQTLLATLFTIALLELEPSRFVQQGGNIVVGAWFAFLATRLGASTRETWAVLALGWCPALVALAFPWGDLSVELRAALSGSWALQPVVLSWILGRRLLGERQVSVEELWGAIAVYVLIGLAFANVYECILLFRPGALLYQNLPPGTGPGFSDILYFSFVTLGTVGYGDVAPVARSVRLVAMFEALIGLMYIAVILGRVVAMHTAGRLRTPDSDAAAPAGE
jgi:hypothetical protein